VTETLIYDLSGKPNERLILIGICRREGATFTYNEENQDCIVTAKDSATLKRINIAFTDAVDFAVRRLVMVRADKKYIRVNARTIDSMFMRGFAEGLLKTRRDGDVVQSEGLLAALEYNDK
jgi:hypothetical protein